MQRIKRRHFPQIGYAPGAVELWVPRVQKRNSQFRKVLHVAGYDGQVVMRSRGGKQAVKVEQRFSPLAAAPL